MARKIIDSHPELKISLGPSPHTFHRTWSPTIAQGEADEFWALVKRHVLPHYNGTVALDMKVVHGACCEHCDYVWTEDSPDYNGGCCEMDEANNPEHLETAEGK